IYMSPAALPTPHQYAIHKVGVSFDSITQCWRLTRASDKSFRMPGTASGQLVSFSGKLYAGENRLPLPLYSVLKGNINARGGSVKNIVRDSFGISIDLSGDGLIDISYEAEILSVPNLTQQSDSLSPDRSLLKPT